MRNKFTLSLFAALCTLACSSDPPPPATADAAPDAAPDATPDALPDVALPDVRPPDVALPDVMAPDAMAPDVAPPDVAPDVAPDARVGCATDGDCLGLTCCGGMCVSVGSNPSHCGGCGRACPAPTGLEGTCMAGACGAPRCPAGRNNCDGNLANGCESDPATDPAHCGACGVACRAGQRCAAGACVDAPCPTGQTRCGAACVDTATSAAHCGRCDNACPARANAAVTCAAGACAAACTPGFADCDGNAANGCEADLRTSAAHCGRCANACMTGLSCVLGGCSLVCPTGQTVCGAACADLRTSAANCGACGRACRAGQTCAASACVGTPTDCAAGTTGCGDACVNTATDSANCGACGRACAEGVTCITGVCAPTCAAGTTRCGLGCFDLTTSPSNCGACGVACGTGQRCSAGACMTCPAETSFSDNFDRADGVIGLNCYRTLPGGPLAGLRGGAACATGAGGEGSAARAVPAGPGAVTVGFDFTLAGDERGVAAVVYTGATGSSVTFAGLTREGAGYRLGVSTLTGPVGTSVTVAIPTGVRIHLEAVFSPTGAVTVRLHPPMLPMLLAGVATATVPMLTFDRAGLSLSGSASTCADDFTLSVAPCAPGLTSCSGACVDLQTSLAHCGACGSVCAAPTGGTAACAAGSCARACPAGFALNGATCENVATTLSGLRWEMACRSPRAPEYCTTSAPTPPTATLGGSPSRLYDVRLRFRGVIELKSYTGGTADGYWYVGGSPVSNAYNIYSLASTAPAQTWYLNAGTQGEVCVGVDYERTVRLQGGARLTLTSNTGTDSAQVSNHDAMNRPIVVPSLMSGAYDGQFVQMDVVSVTLVP